MSTIRVYEPALCCNTGVCGADVDQELVTFTADVNALQAQGIDVQRANLATDPTRFTENPVVVTFLQTAGSEALPLTLVDDVTVLTGRHPSRDEMLRWAGHTDNSPHVELPVIEDCCSDHSASTSCCGDSQRSSGCC
ncbi:arsenite efflux transporter metallochaperone ArsD [Cutibacterium avidum]|uniref:arsenite efflux transporter metallochaperone ArsD n=1 Tax=Cutibacterium avidum TaxID=33010 RepID=UPI0029011420|nr:arsenite efflux transporter metallochaperone ArsD [Cutibacterium avidum]MDU5415392.1 arsenite efflux transporter metallochaperone ArsD [Cutibacterium avidum]MDU5420836.1 arsenite efflux transporter metallochaperone ArsD [Cutibacterium avidum]MDU5516541.1 arsenite efflux transporter metallochaperone ArsD [Cutibacterium avidum]